MLLFDELASKEFDGASSQETSSLRKGDVNMPDLFEKSFSDADDVKSPDMMAGLLATKL